MPETSQQSESHSADELRLVVRRAWEEVLGHADFTDEDGFFDLAGGYSLTAVQVMVVLSDELNLKLPVRLIMRHRSLTELASAISLFALKSTVGSEQ
ncbi:acyl carrier protein [Catenulispora sp. GAS73]|uniref:acyl carrier protein n=1 Tax=Catenulispora sp. GAS73 TaxID=3156269 RepID=UPI0035137671